MTRRYGKPVFGLTRSTVDGVEHDVLEEIVWSRPFCNLLHFVRPTLPGHEEQPKLLIVAPMSGHYATLLRGTVEAFLPTHQVYITDWTDARMVPLALGRFDLDDYIDYLAGDARASGPRRPYARRLPARRAADRRRRADGGGRTIRAPRRR